MTTAGVTQRRATGLVACLLTLAALAASPARAAETMSTMGMEEQAIRILVKSFAAHWKDRKQSGTLRLLTEDAVLIPPNGHPHVQGPDAIRDYWWPRDAPKTGITRFEIEPAEVTTELDLAYVRGRFVLEYWVGEDEAERQTFASGGNWLAIIKRGRDTIWRISRVMWDEPPPGSPPEP